MKTEDRIKEAMSSVLEIPENEITTETSTDTNANWDSITHLNLILALEEEFEISISDDEIATLTSFQAILATISKHNM